MLIKGGRIIDPARDLDAIADLRVEGGTIAEIAEHLQADPGERVVNAQGAYVAPGFIDMHVHLREPGNPEKETIASGTAAAIAGGFTAVASMPNTNPAIDTPELVSWAARAEGAACRVYPIAAITRGRKGVEPVDFAALARAGAVAFSDDGSTVMSARVMRDAAIAARAVSGCVIVHCEDDMLKGDAVMNEGPVSVRLGLRGSPSVAEDAIVARDLLLAADTRKPWHVAHVSTRHSVALVRAARERGVPVTCEVTPHHLVFTEAKIEELGTAAKVNPPLRSPEDVDALRRAVRAGDIDAFATDHAPHTAAEKTAPLECGAVGFSGLEIAVGAYAYALPDLSLRQFVAMLSTNPARILGVPGGTLQPGMPADVTIFADRPWIVRPENFRSKGKTTPFAGMTLPRRALVTIVGGEVVYESE